MFNLYDLVYIKCKPRPHVLVYCKWGKRIKQLQFHWLSDVKGGTFYWIFGLKIKFIDAGCIFTTIFPAKCHTW